MSVEATHNEKMLIELAYKFREAFYKSENTELYFDMLGNCGVVLQLYSQIYHTLLKFDGIVEIENLPHERKKELVEEAKRLSKTNNKEHIIRMSKALHVIGTITQID
jgi:hypothetical protein